MSTLQEIIRALILTFGTTELITNGRYLVNDNGLYLARKQHGELPKDISDNKIRIKVICMLISGCAFFIVGLLCFLLHSYLGNAIRVVTTLFSLYAIVEASYYRYWKTAGFAAVTVVLLILSYVS